MEYVSGENLADLVKKRGPLPVVLSCQFIYQAALGLQHAHDAGMIHRDIKPGNLMVARQGQKIVVKVLDFGLAKAMREAPVDSAKTREGQSLGTPDYNAPEQIIDASNADIRADIYSLGCTLHYLLAGRPPFQGASLYDVYQAHISTDAKPLNLIRPEVPVELAMVVARMMAKEPSRRYQTPAEVAEALKPFCRPGAAVAPSPSATEQTTVGTGASVIPETITVPTPAARPAPQAEEPWSSLIDTSERENSKEANSASLIAEQTKGRPRWAGAVLTGVLVLLGMLIATMIALSVGTKEGVLVFEGLPEDAAVYVDEQKVRVTWPGSGKPAEFSARPGQHGVVVKKEGFEVFSADEVTVETGERGLLPVRLVPIAPRGPDPVPSPGSIPSPDPVSVPPDGLIAFYGFDGGKAEDLSGHGRDGVLSENPPTPIRGPDGTALAFEHSKHTYIELSIDINTNAMPRITMGGWFLTNRTDISQTLISHDNSWFDRTLDIEDRGGADGRKRWSAFTGQKVVAVSDASVGQWVFVAMRHDQDAHKLTIDVDDIRSVHDATFGLGFTKTYVGRNPFFGGGTDLDGRADNVFFYNRVLDDKEIDLMRAKGRAAILPGKPAPAEDGSVGLPPQPSAGGASTKAGGTGNQGVDKPPVQPDRVAPPDPGRSNDGFQSLFNGEDLTGWKMDSGLKGSWKVAQHELVVTGPRATKDQGYLLTEHQFTDFLLRVEYQPSRGANSGVCFWALPNEFAGKVPRPLQIELLDRDAPGVKNGSFAWSRSTAASDLLAPDKSVELKPTGSWNTLEVEARGDRLSVTINGRKILQAELDRLTASPNAQPALWRRIGCIGLQSHSGTVRFRNIEIKELADVPTRTDRFIALHSEREDNALKMKLCWCPPGSFRMGSERDEPERRDDEGPVNVTLSRGFWMGKHEVTQSQWQMVMGTTVEHQETKGTYRGLAGTGPDHAMYFVNHTEAEEFCRKLTENERRAGRLSAFWEYRLPTEAQWEYACRAGTTTATAFGDQLSSLNANFNGDLPYNKAAKGPNLREVTPVGRYRPNPWGLYDMHGNVREWCRDGYAEQLTAGVDPLGPSGASARVLRDGSWYLPGGNCRSSSRSSIAPGYRDSSLGFRAALAPSSAIVAVGDASGLPTAGGETGEVGEGHTVASSAPGPSRRRRKPSTVATSPASGMKLVLVPAGWFVMGALGSEKDALSVAMPHRVKITRPFYLSMYEVTVGQFRKIAELSKLTTDAERNGKGGIGWNRQTLRFEQNSKFTWRFPGFEQTDDHPVVELTWNDAVRYCNALSEKEGLAPYYQFDGDNAPASVPDWNGVGYRLPTEAEWEYACRAGSTTRYNYGDEAGIPGQFFWHGEGGPGTTHPVGQHPPNALGLFDMHGNALEWCWDGFEANYYKNSPGADPTGPPVSTWRICRGGRYNDPAITARSGHRSWEEPGALRNFFGFRVARNPHTQPAASQTKTQPKTPAVRPDK